MFLQTYLLVILINQCLNGGNAAPSVIKSDEQHQQLELIKDQRIQNPTPVSFIQRINDLPRPTSKEVNVLNPSQHFGSIGNRDNDHDRRLQDRDLLLNYIAIESNQKPRPRQFKDVSPLTYSQFIQHLCQWQKDKEHNFYHLNSAAGGVNQLTSFKNKL